MNKKEIATAGALLYVCEGTVLRKDPRGKNTYIYAIELTNSNPKIIALFCIFLRKVLKVNYRRVKGQLFIYPDHDERKIKEFWSKCSSIPLTQFQKVIHLKQKNKKFRPSRYGTFKIRYNDKKDFLALQKIIRKTWKDAGVADQAVLERP